MLIGAVLGIMLILAFISVFFGSDIGIGINWSERFQSNSIVNGTIGSWSSQEVSLSFNVDAVQGALIILISIALFSSLIGIRIWNSGLSDSAFKTLSSALIYFYFFTMLTILAFPLIDSIPVFGSLLFIGLTFLYVIGVIQKITAGGNRY